ncbi:PREDICTED: PMS1 protein homolog 1 isoform X1 [Polistes canadensis]|uniref:PMS1 protein homolog 1 isoform X1 n=1 Tax=Polistes canadensis TaxID=91411 RepID=UPI000718FC94|nr:PREDICTED: PMS1 protein homolog 1 isoform X1 [Polistes canadensis]
MSITSLDENTIRLVTTTQVITSVYSVVKELVENAFDANAKNIEINLIDNGTSMIEVKDDGDGISNVNASFIALPSSTSKISCFEDLGMLKTYGFRGEALNALCKMSDVVIMTKTENDEVGRLYNMDNDGNIMTTESYPRPKGTTVQVKQMFRQLPVRRKLITDKRKANQNIKLIETMLKSFGICNFTVRISYRVNNNIIFMKPNLDNIKEAAQYVLGRRIMSKMKWITHEDTEATIQLMIPDRGLEDINEICETTHRYIFINNRPIKYKDIEKVVNDTISEYFSNKLSVKRKLIFLVYILVDPADIDVNLEPNKDTVLLKNQQIILDIISKLVINFYDIQSEELKRKNSTEISNYERDSSINNTNNSETELPVCKKRKILADTDEKETKKCTNGESIKKKTNNNTTELLNSEITKDNSNSKNTTNDLISTDNRCNISEDELKAIANYLDTTTNSHNSSKRNSTDINCTNNNDLKHDNTSNPEYTNDSLLRDLNSTDEKINNQETINTLDNQVDVINESISQLPVVDLGEDFEIDLILNEENSINPHIDKVHDKKNNEKEEHSLKMWSKGHVEGLKGGTDVKPFNDCTNYVSLSNDSSTMETTFTKFAKDIRSEIMKENPKLSTVEVARKITDIWKHLPSQEHGYYQDLAREEKLNKEKARKDELKKKLHEESKKNKKRLLRMLENMKNSNTQKSENLAMRTTVPWNMNIDNVRKSFKNRCDYNNIHYVVGSININLWIIQNSAQLWLLDISQILKGLNVTDLTIDKIQSEDVEKLFKQWILEKKDMSMIYPIYTLT